MEATVRTNWQELSEMFETRKRDNGEHFVVLKDSAPEWAGDFVREAHGTAILPDDYRYEYIRDALEFLAEADEDQDPNDLAAKFADQTDPYTDNLLTWLSSNLFRLSYCDEAQDEGLLRQDADIPHRIAAGQYMERMEIFNQVIQAAENIPNE